MRAEEFEQTGRWGDALQIYETLYDEDPENVGMFNRLKDGYLKVNQYNRVIELLKDRLSSHPNNLDLKIDIAHVEYKMGDKDGAMKHWREILENNPKDKNVYDRVAGVMIDERLIDEAIQVYQLGRTQTREKDMFSFKLAGLYGANIQYGKAVDELLFYLVNHPNQISIVENEIFRYPKSERIVQEIGERIQKAISEKPNNLDLRQVFCSYLFHAGHYSESLKATFDIEQMVRSESQGEELFQFAQNAFHSGALSESEKAYQMILKTFPRYSNQGRVSYGLAQCYEAQGKFIKAVEMFQQVFDLFPKSSYAVEALYQKGLIFRDKLFDYIQAEKIFQMVLKYYPDSVENFDSRLDLGICFLNQGDLDQAAVFFRQAFEEGKKQNSSDWIRALICLADANYLMGKFDEALEMLQKLSEDKMNLEVLQNPTFNDGLKERLFLEEHCKRAKETLSYYARGELFERMRRYDQALAVLDSLLNRWPDDPIAADALFKEGEIKIMINHWVESQAKFDTLSSRFSNSLLADRALERSGWIDEQLRERNRAKKKYEMLIERYPHSLLVDEIRSRIRLLEKD